MKIRIFGVGLIFLLVFFQNTEAQKVLLLQKPGTTKRFFYHTSDKIWIRTGEPEFSVKGIITYIDDSVCTIDRNYTYKISNIKEVVRTRHFLNGSWRLIFLTSGVYAAMSIINSAIHNEKPVIDNSVPIISGSFIALGTTAWSLRYRHCKMEKDWRLKVLDFDIMKAENEGKEE